MTRSRGKAEAVRPAGAPAAASAGRRLRLVLPFDGSHDHVWQLRSVEYDDGLCIRRLECDGCGGVNFA